MTPKIDVNEVLQRIKIMVCLDRQYAISNHVIEYMEADRCSYGDIEYCIQNADTIHGIARDDREDSVDGLLYTIKGQARIGTPFYTAGKFKKTEESDEIYYFITAHEIEET